MDKVRKTNNYKCNTASSEPLGMEHTHFVRFEVLMAVTKHNAVSWDITPCSLIEVPITMAARSKAWIVFVPSNIGVVSSNPTRGMDVCVSLFCVCVGSGLATGWSSVQGVLPSVYRLNWKSVQGPKGCRAVEREREGLVEFFWRQVNV
jgi:hypothetical protein